MIIEVFKEYIGGVRLFNSVNPDYVTWLFDSKNRRDGSSHPPYRNTTAEADGKLPENSSYINDQAPSEEDLPGTIYLDQGTNGLELYATQKNIVLDTSAPKLRSWTGNFISFERDRKWSIELILRDESGIDTGVFELYKSGESNPFYGFTRKNSESPYYLPTPVIDGQRGATVSITQSTVDKALYRVSIVLDQVILGIDQLIDFEDDCRKLSLAFKFFDLAGNVFLGDMSELGESFVDYDVDREEILSNAKPLSVTFRDTYPAGFFVDNEIIGKTIVRVSGFPYSLARYGLGVKIVLYDDSVGYLSGTVTCVDEELGIYEQTVDGIDRSGYVKVYAYIGSVSGGELSSIDLGSDVYAVLKSRSIGRASTGPFITECADNNRKLNLEHFVPDVLKNEEIFGLVKALERYLNTAFPNLEDSCRIGILEKISRINLFKDPDRCEKSLLPRFAEEHGSELIFNYGDVKNCAEILAKYEPEATRETSDELAESIYRRFFNLLPYISRWKGTDFCVEILYRVLGIEAHIHPLWEGEGSTFLPELSEKEILSGERQIPIPDDYRLTAHLEVALESEKISSGDMKTISDFAIKSVKSVLPVTRVLSDVLIYERLRTDDSLKLNTTLQATTFRKTDPEVISFTWLAKNMSALSYDYGGRYTLRVPAYPDLIEGGLATGENDMPFPDYAGGYFNRFREYIKTYGSRDIILTIGTGKFNGSGALTGSDLSENEVRMRVEWLREERNQIVMTLKTDDYSISSLFNNLALSDDSVFNLCFKFSRDVENYCECIEREEYDRLMNPQEYDTEDIPDNSMHLVPLDRPKWLESIPFIREQDAILIEDSASWSEGYVSSSEQEAILISDEPTWSESVVSMEEHDVN